VGDGQLTVQDARGSTQDKSRTTQAVPRNTDAELLLAGLGIRKARKLAALPATSVELVEAWAREAERRGGLKDKAGFVAVGVESGEHPAQVTPFQNSMWAPVVRMPAAKDAVMHADPHLELWDKALARLSTLVDPVSWETWLAPTHLLDIIDNIAVVGAPNVFARDEVQRRYVPQIATALSTELGRAVEVEVVIGTLVAV
jgi:hypothetical protein